MTDPTAVEQLLDQFRRWLQEIRDEANSPGYEDAGPLLSDAEPVPEVGLFRLIEEFTALRHELKLQTRSARGLQEQAEALLPALRQAIEQFRAIEPKEAQASWATGKSLAEALADLDEALDRGRAEIEKAAERISEKPDQTVKADLNELYARQSWLQRRLNRSYHEQVRELISRRNRRPLFDALLEGYNLIQNRLRRVLTSERIERIECLGQPVEPDRMIVIDVVDDPESPPGHVVEEIRRGYTWQDRLLRSAEVRAARVFRDETADSAFSPTPIPDP